MSLKRLSSVALLSGLVFSMSAHAVNGALDFAYSTIMAGMAGAGVALPQDTLIAAINPAGMVDVGKRMDLGTALYIPNTTYSATVVNPAQVSSIAVASGMHRSGVSFFLLPNFGLNFPIDKKSSVGLSVYSLAGFGAKFSTQNLAVIGPVQLPGPDGDQYLEANYKLVVNSLTYARKFLKRSSFGVSLLVGAQAYYNHGEANLASLSAYGTKLSAQGDDYATGVGTRAGFLFGLGKKWDLGFSYQPKIIMSKFKKYAGLFYKGGELDVPPIGNIGLAWHVLRRVTLEGDFEEIIYRDAPSYGAPNASLLNGQCTANSAYCLGGSHSPGFGMNNANIYKIGAQWKVNHKLTLRAGVNHSNQILTSSHATENMIIPGAAVRDLLTIGATEKFSKRDSLSGMAIYIPKQSRIALNQFSGAAAQHVTVAMGGFGFGISWGRMLDL